MNSVTCRNCDEPLKKVGNSWACQSCRSSYVDFAFIQNHFSSNIYDQIFLESQNMSMTSRHACAFCQQQMAAHILFSIVQIESCFGCKVIWFDAGEIRKIQSLKAEKGLQLPSMGEFQTNINPTSDSALTTLAKKNPFFAMVVMAIICFIVLKACENRRYYRPYHRPYFRISF